MISKKSIEVLENIRVMNYLIKRLIKLVVYLCLKKISKDKSSIFEG